MSVETTAGAVTLVPAVLQAAATLFMAGLIWFVQIVHYPLFGRVGEAGFAGYHALHTRRVTWLVAPAMMAEAASALWLAVAPPAGIAPLLPYSGLALVVVIWLSTALLQMPRHRALAAGLDRRHLRGLVLTNWVRTLAWTVRAPLALWMLLAAAAARSAGAEAGNAAAAILWTT